MTIHMLLYLMCGTVCMAAVMLLCRRTYGISVPAAVVSAPLLTVIGVLGVKLMFFIENRNFDGTSFFGAVFFVPVLAYPVSLALRVRYTHYLDIAAPSVSAMLAVMKVKCMKDGCCGGTVLYVNRIGENVTFPSQIFELAVAAVICVTLVMLIRSGVLRQNAYPFFMVTYGSTRFILNFFRNTVPFLFGLPAGSLWALLSVFLGGLWLALLHFRSRSTQNKQETKA